jgi:poly(3-hydroxybutyrate) depolymerase
MSVLLLTQCATPTEDSEPTPTPAATAGPAATVAPAATQLPLGGLAHFDAPELGIRGAVPAEWVEAEPGHFMPPDARDWDTRLIHEFYPGVTVDELAETLLLPVLGLNELPTPTSGNPSLRLPWRLYAIELKQRSLAGLWVDLALAESEVGAYLVALLTRQQQRDTLRASVFLPALDALEPIAVEDSMRYYEAGLALFDYDRSAPLDVQELSSETQLGRTVTNLTYASPKGGRVPATLIVPNGEGPFAGMVIQHGMPSNRQRMNNTGERYARAGAVVVAIDAPHARPEHAARASGPIDYTTVDREEQIQLMVDLQRAVDLLLARPDVDPERLAYLGVSYGGAMGGLFAGVEDRLQAFVLVVGDGGLVTHEIGVDDLFGGLYSLPQEDREAWWEAMWPIEPIHFVGHAAPAALLFQNGRQDRLVPLPDAVRFQLSGSEPKDIMWYDAGHGLGIKSLRDQAAWLQQQIGIDAAAVQ